MGQSHQLRDVTYLLKGDLMASPEHTDAAGEGVSSTLGYYPVPCDIAAERFSIETLPDYSIAVSAVAGDSYVYKGWVYPGPQSQVDIGSGRTHAMPYSARVFGLPKTHRLVLRQSKEPADLDFVVWCLSFFTGMRLTTTEAGFLDATPVTPGKLVDFILSRCTLQHAVELALAYIDSERLNPRSTKRVAAVVHALFLAQCPRNLLFESFQYLYMALDACYSLMAAKEPKDPRVPHASRVQWMCEKFGLQAPPWATSTDTGAAHLAIVRNDAFHEGLFFGQPLGFAIDGGSQGIDSGTVILQMQALVCRLLVAILGRPKASYVQSPADTRARHALDLNN